jgi:hypothetical protein
MALVEVRVPDIGDFKDVAVIELLVKAGDTVKAEQSLITVESDKARWSPSSTAGVVKEMKVALGDKVNEGSLVLLLDGAAGFGCGPRSGGRGGTATSGLDCSSHSIGWLVPAAWRVACADIGDFRMSR